MTAKNEPNLAKDLRLVHLVITRGLDVSIDNAVKYARGGFPNPELHEGYRKYVTALLSFVSAHHLAEDEIAFPYFETRMPETPFNQLKDEHERIEQLLEQGQEHLTQLDDEPEAALRDLDAVLSEMRDLWHPHIDTEEAHFDVERLADILPPEEHERLSGKMAQHTIEHAEPTPLVVPFGLYNLPDDQRKILVANMPPDVINELVPGPWRDEWAPMEPFLLV